MGPPGASYARVRTDLGLRQLLVVALEALGGGRGGERSGAAPPGARRKAAPAPRVTLRRSLRFGWRWRARRARRALSGRRGRLARALLAADGVACRALAWRDKSSEPGLNLSGSWQQGHSAAYNTPFLIQVVCKGFIARGQEIVMAHGSCDTLAHGFPRAVDRFPSGMDSNLEAFSYNPTHGSFGASPYRAAPIPMVRIGGSSRTEPNYRRKTSSSRVKLTCLTTV